jgi:hypothetical protein
VGFQDSAGNAGRVGSVLVAWDFGDFGYRYSQELPHLEETAELLLKFFFFSLSFFSLVEKGAWIAPGLLKQWMCNFSRISWLNHITYGVRNV